MPDEENETLLETPLEDEPEKKTHPIDKRITKALSDRDTALAEKEKLVKAKTDEEKKRLEAEKDRDFYKGFSTLNSKYPGASEYQDKILEKVRAGYEQEDATISILAKEGKYTPPPPPEPDKENPAGGSATTQVKTGTSKSLSEMKPEEKLDILKDLERKGDFSVR